jgi:hypothetical protein
MYFQRSGWAKIRKKNTKNRCPFFRSSDVLFITFSIKPFWEKIKHTETYLQLPNFSQNAMQNLTDFRFFKVEFPDFLYSVFLKTFPRSLQKSVTFGVPAQPRLKMTVKMKNGETRISAKKVMPLIKKN